MTRVRMPGLLNGELLETARLPVLSGQYQLTADEPSQATLTIPEDGPVVKLRDWIALHDAAGLMGIYRVTNITQTVRRHIQLTLMHGIDVLADSHWAAETEYKGKPRGFLEAALNEQTALIDGVKPWQLGACEDTETDLDEKISYSRLSDVVPKAVQEGGDYQFEYDQSHFPWTMNLVRKPIAAACEFRLLRNITSATITYNDADLCTRLILSNTSGGESRVRVYDAGAAIQAEWGVVTKTASIDTNDDLDAASWPEAEAWVAAFFALHAAPSVQIQIEGRELFSLTGESWDRASLGRMCRVALPDYGHTFLERVVGITYPDPFGDPDRVVVSLANALPKFSETVKLLEKTAQSASRAAGGAARKADQTEAALDEHKVLYQAAINKTDREISGIASATGLQFNADGTPVVDENGEFVYSETHPDNALIAQIQLQAGRYDRIIQATGISETAVPGEVSLVTQVSQTHQQISQAAIATGLVWDASLNDGAGGFKVDPDAIGSSVYKQLAGQISAKVSASDVKTQVEAYGYLDLTAAKNAAAAEIGAQLDNGTSSISAKVKALVEGDTSLIQLVADEIDLDGYVRFKSGTTDWIEASTISAESIIWSHDGQDDDLGDMVGALFDDTADAYTAIRVVADANGNTYHLEGKTVSSDSWDTIENTTFSRAASGISVSWSGTTGTVTVLPQNQDFTITDDAQVSSFSLLKLGNSITISPYINHGQTDSGGNPTNERNSSSWNISAAAPALTGAIPSGHNAGTGVGPAPTSKSAIAPGDTVIPYVQIGGKYFYGSSVTVPPATAQQLMKVVKADSQIVLAADGTLSTVTIGKPAISTNKPANTLPNVITTLTPGQTFYPHVKVGNDYFYGDAITAPSGANVESSHPHTMSANTETVTPSNGYDAMAQVVVDATPRYYAGKAAVVLSDTPTWGTTPSSNITAAQNTVTVSTSGRTNTSGTTDERTKSINLYSNVTKSGLTATFYVTHTNSTDANRIIKRETTFSDSNLTPENIKENVWIFGVKGSYTGSTGSVNLSGWQLSNGSAVNLVQDSNNNTLQTVTMPPAANWFVDVGTWTDTSDGKQATINVRPMFSLVKGDPVKTDTVNVALTTATITPGSSRIVATPATHGANRNAIGFSSVTIEAASGDQEEGQTYADGWRDALADVELVRSPDTGTPTFGQTVSVTAKAKANPTAGSKTAISGASTTIAAPDAPSGTVTVTNIAKHGNQTFSSSYKTVYFPVRATYSDGTYSSDYTVSCDITSAYNKGKTDGITAGDIITTNARQTSDPGSQDANFTLTYPYYILTVTVGNAVKKIRLSIPNNQ